MFPFVFSIPGVTGADSVDVFALSLPQAVKKSVSMAMPVIFFIVSV
jgi:hypothetical protein